MDMVQAQAKESKETSKRDQYTRVQMELNNFSMVQGKSTCYEEEVGLCDRRIPKFRMAGDRTSRSIQCVKLLCAYNRSNFWETISISLQSKGGHVGKKHLKNITKRANKSLNHDGQVRGHQ